MRFSDSVNDAIALLETISNPGYNVLHARGVVDIALNLCAFYDADPEIVEIACWWHDTGKIDNEKNHELLSASLAYENLSLHGFSARTSRIVYDAIVSHRPGMVPKSVEGRILKDANNLDLLSVERWKQCIEFRNRGLIGSLEERKPAIKLIPKMRDSVLVLEKSRMVFDHIIGGFLDFFSSSPDHEIRQYFNELVSRAML